MVGSYPGWPSLSAKFREAISLFVETGVIKSVYRLGLRYINFFDRDVLSQLTLSLLIQGKPVDGESTFFKTTLAGSSCRLLLQVGKDVELTHKPGTKGTVIDIDAYLDQPQMGLNFTDRISRFLQEGHEDEKRLFYRLLGPELLKSLNPKYSHDT
jgi:uncharacterized protein (TIGR04255 family)